MKCLIIVLLLSSVACSHNLKKPLFYSIEKDGKQSHLLASVERGVPYNRLPESIKQTIQAATQIYIPEMQPDDSELHKDIIRELLFKTKEEPALFEVLSAPTYQFTYDIIQTQYTDDKFIAQLSPFGARSLVEQIKPARVYVRDRLEASQFNVGWSIKAKITEQKKSQVLSLDSEQYWRGSTFRKCYNIIHASALDSMAKDNAPYDLKWMIDEAEIYKTGDEQQIAKFLQTKVQVYGQAYDQYCLQPRNKDFTKAIATSVMKQPGSFYVIDIENILGVISGLKSEGFKVERLQQP